MTLAPFQNRRKALFSKMKENSIAFIASAPHVYRNSDTEFPYRQNSHFYYLTGFDEANAIAVFIKKQNQTQFILFCQENDLEAEKWTGPRWGLTEAKKQFGADETFAITQQDTKMPQLMENTSTVYQLIESNAALQKKILSWVKKVKHKVRQGIEAPCEFYDLSKLLNELRLIKSEDEIERIQKACDISVQAHINAMKGCKVGMYEYGLEGILLQTFYEHGSRYPAYPCIVAAGNNACILHYTRNDKKIAEGDLVLIDAGAEYDYYAADITRTFPANGQFSQEQRAIYELVLNAQLAAIDKATQNTPWNQIQQTIIAIIVDGLVALKILKGKPQDLIEQKAYFPFYMHNSGHWLGMDVHDVGDYRVQGQWRPLVQGMVLTIEPGIYIAKNNTQVDEKWRGIGVRIEDDILITQNKPKVLTEKVPKTIEDMKQIL